ncbi:MAG: competence/damage-inducible protein A [Verrucomicrobiota bacterium]|nr:competence/damage-inducible protein A [Verrucomicrobiota bacterium]
MDIELITIGTELLLGQVLDTHQHWLGQRLAEHGRPLTRQLTVPDDGPAICGAVQVSLGRARLVITTGGLGPTDDDLTRRLLADLLGRPLSQDASVAAQINDYFRQRNRPMLESVLVQAQVPEGAVVFPNRHGTAPGLAIEVAPNRFGDAAEPAWLILLPGPPRELRPMFAQQVLPFLEEQWPLRQAFHCRILRSLGIGESAVEEMLREPLRSLKDRGLELGYCARIGQVDIRLSGSGPDMPTVIDEAEAAVRAVIGKHIYGTGEETVAQTVVARLNAASETVAVAESCTGGLLGHLITNVPGASAVFAGGVLSYSNDLKQKLLGVKASTLEQHGAVSKPVALEMAEGALNISGADHTLSVTGIAGPEGGTPDKPVGTVWLGLASRGQRPLALRKFYPFEREAFKHATVHQALDLLRRRLRKNG